MTHSTDFNHGISDSFELISVGDNYFGKNAEGKSVWTNQACLYHPAFSNLTLLLLVTPTQSSLVCDCGSDVGEMFLNHILL